MARRTGVLRPWKEDRTADTAGCGRPMSLAAADAAAEMPVYIEAGIAMVVLVRRQRGACSRIPCLQS